MSRTNWPLRVRQEDAGNLVFEALHEDPTIDEGMATTGLTANQWHNGLAYVKDVLAEANTAPVLYDPHTRRYSLALGEDTSDSAVRAYERWRLAVELTQLRRLLDGTARPAAARFGTVSTRRLVRYLEGAIEEVSLLLDEVK